MIKCFTDTAWEDYSYWLSQDKKMVKRIHQLLSNIDSTPYSGIGKPEPLKHELSGLWSRRINGADRLTYKVLDDIIVILACKGHYE